jgi:hypothetical protein
MAMTFPWWTYRDSVCHAEDARFWMSRRRPWKMDCVSDSRASNVAVVMVWYPSVGNISAKEALGSRPGGLGAVGGSKYWYWCDGF